MSRSTKKTVKANPNRAKYRIIFGAFLFFGGLASALACLSFLMHWKSDLSAVNALGESAIAVENVFNSLGLFIGYLLVYKGFGISGTLIPVLLLITGFILFFNLSKRPLISLWSTGLFWMLWITFLLYLLLDKGSVYAGIVGYEIGEYIELYIGRIGLLFSLLFTGLVYAVIAFKWTPSLQISSLRFPSIPLKKLSLERFKPSPRKPLIVDESDEFEASQLRDDASLNDESIEIDLSNEPSLISFQKTEKSEETFSDAEPQIAFEIASTDEDELDKKSTKLVEDFGEFDPTLELSNYKAPHIDLLDSHGIEQSQIEIDKEELGANKNRIVDTLNNYNIAIERITATVGPTVTLYEIVPEAGIRISKIKNLEDDIALSLSALGIRIIAPIPGKGTIGIEVPNKQATVVSMRSVIGSKKFSKAPFDLPIAFGKTISNETFVVDLAKMPHLLMAGATGQGKSVGLNAVLTSLLYKKHPAEIKFVLVDPKKVELTLYNKIERHFLAKLPNVEDAIITDTKKVINTLNSLCLEMDDRYDLLKAAMVRNIKEYNAKFVKRKLNPNDGHRFLPYIVLVIDEFADLIMTAGKEVETPIARLAQLARAIGIHLIIATQRPSVNVITGIIKANFPARLAFRVTSKIDSRTILDASGAEQLIGRGDMLFTQGNEMIRLQCAFVDTPEVEKITDYIGSQRAYAQAYLLPEYEADDVGGVLSDDINDRDPLFKEAAEIVVGAQQGSTSLIQRKMKIGYNRAGRIIDQLEAAGIVGPFEGSRARQVMFKDLNSLQTFLENQ
ncbi:MAG: DNA translocase FtsK [Flavobacteriaceae bacterium]